MPASPGFPRVPCAREGVLRAVLEELTVGEARERVVERLVDELGAAVVEPLHHRVERGGDLAQLVVAANRERRGEIVAADALGGRDEVVQRGDDVLVQAVGEQPRGEAAGGQQPEQDEAVHALVGEEDADDGEGDQRSQHGGEHADEADGKGGPAGGHGVHFDKGA